MREGRKALGVRTNAEAVEMALREAVRRKKVLGLRNLFGTNFWEGDLDAMRGRGKAVKAKPTRRVRNGVPLLPRRRGAKVTSTLVRHLDEKTP